MEMKLQLDDADIVNNLFGWKKNILEKAEAKTDEGIPFEDALSHQDAILLMKINQCLFREDGWEFLS